MSATDDEAADVLAAMPTGLARQWGFVEPSRRGPKARLSFAQVVGSAVAIADEAGLDAVSMAAVASRLGVAPMSLYRHVDSKDQLLEAMADAVLDEPPEVGDSGWRRYLAGWTRASRDQLITRPWLVDTPRNGPPLGPRSIAWLEHGLQGLRGTPLDGGEKINVLTTLNAYAFSEASLAVAMGRAAGARADAGLAEVEAYGRLLAALASTRGLDEVAAVARAGVFSGGEEWLLDSDFVFGLDLLLDGVEALVARRTG
ncbi:TetR/AcrR family transcriptional regulator [Georgenia sp. Z1344]|uniref:TetR/AcrR family transcriptional regulator n=1 Tax=Georgenia sp. Z1344 TaxID=3416706 RepID=UPI003CEDB9EA